MLFDRIIDRIFLRSRAVSPRRYISPELGVAGFFQALNEAGVSYIVLRWFESLPVVQPGEDVDLLIGDDDSERINSFLSGTSRDGIPCDVYTVSGLPGSDYDGIPYLPPALAKEVLASAVLGANDVRIPSQHHHLLTMAYHALFHKGYLAGLPAVAGAKPRHSTPDHDYANVLTQLAQSAGASSLCSGLLNMEIVYDYLKTNAWAPPADTIDKLAAENNWIQDTFLSDDSNDAFWDGLTVFIVREQGLQHLPLIRDELCDEGFNLLYEEQIAQDVRQSFAEQVRGGNWARGPFASSAGGPAYVLVMLDLFPLQPSTLLRAQHFGLTNERSYHAKLRVRRAVNSQLQPEERCNVMHSSDNARQALHYFSLLQSSATDQKQLGGSIQDLRREVTLPWPVSRIISNVGRHAILRMVDYEGAWAICKTFRPGHESYLESELLAREIAVDMPQVLPILARKGLHLLFPLWTKVKGPRFFSGSEMSVLRHVIRSFRAKGYELSDFTPQNIVRDKNHGLLIVDLESLQSVEPCSGIVGCWCWYDDALRYSSRFPHRKSTKDTRYYRFWYDRTGLPLWMAVRDVPQWVASATQVGVRGSFALKQLVNNWRGAVVSALRR